MGRHVRRSCNEAGFASVDALVALTILAMVIALALTSVQSAARAARAALEARRATELLTGLLGQTPPVVSERSGRTGVFNWRAGVTARETSSNGVVVCDIEATARSLTSGRAYRLVTAKLCATGRPT